MTTTPGNPIGGDPRLCLRPRPTQAGRAPLLSVFGGKITTYRKLAEHALDKLRPFFPQMRAAWTAGAPLPGGDMPTPISTRSWPRPAAGIPGCRRRSRCTTPGSTARAPTALLGRRQAACRSRPPFRRTVLRARGALSAPHEWARDGGGHPRPPHQARPASDRGAEGRVRRLARAAAARRCRRRWRRPSGMPDLDGPLHLGIDVGTSGVRAFAIDGQGRPAAQVAGRCRAAPNDGGAIDQDPAIWWQTLDAALLTPAHRHRSRPYRQHRRRRHLRHAAADRRGGPAAGAGRHVQRCQRRRTLAARIKAAAPAESGAHGATSPLARLLRLQPDHPEARHALHQADWIAGRLSGRLGASDENNALKLGYDPVRAPWPAWLDALGVRRELLPEVVAPGTPLGPMTPDAGREPRPARALPGRRRHHRRLRLLPGHRRRQRRRRRHRARHHADAEAAVRPARLRARPRRLQPSAGRSLAGRRRLQQRRRGAAALLHAERMAELTPLLRPEQPDRPALAPAARAGRALPGGRPDPDLRRRSRCRPTSCELFQALLEGIAEVEARAYAAGPRARRPAAALGAHGRRRCRQPGLDLASAPRLLGVPMLPPVNLEAGLRHGPAGAPGSALAA